MNKWIFLTGDVNWKDYGGKWACLAPDGSWYVLAFENMYEAMGERDCKVDGVPEFNVELKRLDLLDLTETNVHDALKSCGYYLENGTIFSDQGDEVSTPATRQLVLLEVCIGYGFGAPIESYSGSNARKLITEAKRYAAQCIANTATLAKQLERPVNEIGSTAEEYGRGDVYSAMHRGPFDTRKQIVRKMHGFPPKGEL